MADMIIEMDNVSEEGPQRLQLHIDSEAGQVSIEIVDPHTSATVLELVSTDLDAMEAMLSQLRNAVWLEREWVRLGRSRQSQWTGKD